METIGVAFCGTDGRYALKVCKEYLSEKPTYLLYYVDNKLGRIEMIEHLNKEALSMFKILVQDAMREGMKI